MKRSRLAAALRAAPTAWSLSAGAASYPDDALVFVDDRVINPLTNPDPTP